MLSVVDAPSGIVLEPKARLPFAAPSSNVNPMILSLLRHNRKAPPPGSPSPSPLPFFNWEPDHRTPRSAHAAKGMGPRARWLKAGHHHAPGTVPRGTTCSAGPKRAFVEVLRDSAVECVGAEVKHLKRGEGGEMHATGMGLSMVDDDNGWSP